jgi:hypothetical protein
MRILTGAAIAAISGVAMLALSLSPASAFTLSDPSLERPVASGQIEKVWWRHGWYGGGWHGGYRGWHGGRWGMGYRRCWINRWGYRVCRW